MPQGSAEGEIVGNSLVELAVKCCFVLHTNGREFMLESSAPDGVYPKIWDLECVRRLRQQTNAKVVPIGHVRMGTQT